MNFNNIDPLQCTEALIGGFNNGFNAILESNRVDREIRAMAQGKQVDAWRIYANALAAKNEELSSKLYLMRNDYDQVVDQLAKSRRNHIEYIGMMVEHIEALDETIQRQSANFETSALMRERLMDELRQLTDPVKCSLLNPEKQLELLQQGWDDFMEQKDVRPRVPVSTDGYTRAAEPLSGDTGIDVPGAKRPS